MNGKSLNFLFENEESSLSRTLSFKNLAKTGKLYIITLLGRNNYVLTDYYLNSVMENFIKLIHKVIKPSKFLYKFLFFILRV